MQISLLEMQRNPTKILDAIARKDSVILTDHGKPVARIESIRDTDRPSTKDLEFFGMWADREDMSDPVAYVRAVRSNPAPLDSHE